MMMPFVLETRVVVGLALLALTVGLGIAAWVGTASHGPVRWVRLMTVASLLAAVGSLCLLVSAAHVLGLLGIVLTTTLLSSAIGALFWSMPARFDATPHPFDPPDDRLRNWAERRAAEAEALGFVRTCDAVSEWRFGRDVRRSWVRYLRIPSGQGWAELAVLVRPKASATRIVSVLADGRVVETCDRPTNSAALGDEKTVAVKTPEGAPVQRMLQVHEERVAAAGGAALPVEDPLRSAREAADTWRERMIATGKLVQRGDSLRVRPGAVPAVVLRTLSALVR
jgi:hypothetical protein